MKDWYEGGKKGEEEKVISRVQMANYIFISIF